MLEIWGIFGELRNFFYISTEFRQMLNKIYWNFESNSGKLGRLLAKFWRKLKIFLTRVSIFTTKPFSFGNRRYGHSAATFTQDTFETVGNGIEIGTHLRFFTPKTMAKATAKGVVRRPERRSSDGQSSTSSQSRAFEEISRTNSSPTPSTSAQNQCGISQPKPKVAPLQNLAAQAISGAPRSSIPTPDFQSQRHFEILQPTVLPQPNLSSQPISYPPVVDSVNAGQDLLAWILVSGCLQFLLLWNVCRIHHEVTLRII